jgi:hypothetical protein
VSKLLEHQMLVATGSILEKARSEMVTLELIWNIFSNPSTALKKKLQSDQGQCTLSQPESTNPNTTK